jgi:hypothetical protein
VFFFSIRWNLLATVEPTSTTTSQYQSKYLRRKKKGRERYKKVMQARLRKSFKMCYECVDGNEWDEPSNCLNLNDMRSCKNKALKTMISQKFVLTVSHITRLDFRDLIGERVQAFVLRHRLVIWVASLVGLFSFPSIFGKVVKVRAWI